MRRFPWRLYRYFGFQIAATFAVAVTALTLLYYVVVGIQGVYRDLPIRIVLTWATASIGVSFFFTIPISLLVSGSLTYGRLVADREYTAVTSAGLSPLHFYVPMGILSSALAGIGALTHGTVLPDAHYAQRDLSRYVLPQIASLGDRFDEQLPVEDGVVWFAEVRDGRYLRGIHVEKKFPRNHFRLFDDGTARPDERANEDEDPRPPVTVILDAARGSIEVDADEELIRLVLTGVDMRVSSLDSQPLSEVGRAHETFRMDDLELEFSTPHTDRRRTDFRNPQLAEEIVRLAEEIDHERAKLATIPDAPSLEEQTKLVEYLVRTRQEYQAEYWRRKALAISILTFGFLSFATSFSFRYSHWLSALFYGALLVILVFYPLLLLGETLCAEVGMPAPVALLLGNAALLLVSMILCRRIILR
ncbi:MAG: LptF/LptG family permease [Planctomycetes bacterium]|nr:LptF/LptG family permease [Planctomycetota bacterium]